MSVGKPIKDIQLVFRQRGWGDNVEFENIMDLIRNTAFHINQYLRNPFQETINVHPAPIEDYVPRVYRESPNDPDIIQLTARNRKWAQYAYQFSHEYCHVLSNYRQLENNKNGWFHEALCELASVFTLRSMATQWKTHAPFRQWIDYADDLDSYVQDRLSNPDTQLQEGIPLQVWLLYNEDMSRTSNYRNEVERNKQALVAYQLLPIFEDTPSGWNAIRNFPISEGYLKDYLLDWYSLVDEEDKPFVACISDAFGYTIT